MYATVSAHCRKKGGYACVKETNRMHFYENLRGDEYYLVNKCSAEVAENDPIQYEGK